MKKSRAFVVFILYCLLSASLAAQWSVYHIPDNLKERNHAVVREDATDFHVKDPANAVMRRTVVITILDEQGSAYADFSCYTDMYSSIGSFSGEVYDREGKSIRKIRKGDLKFTDYFAGLASDTRQHYYEPAITSYPYTIRYEYEISYKNRVFGFPLFVPAGGRNTSVQMASYKLTVPQGYVFHTHAQQLDVETVKTTVKQEDIYEWKLENYPGLVYEPFSKPFYEMIPLLYISPDSFVFGNTRGSMSDWEQYSQWQWELMKGRDILPEGLKEEVRRITANANSDREKIRLLYDYLGATTRYVSIQIGIGGFQPMTVEEVYRNKYGDCKALSFYMQAMLRECGIESYYTEIGIYNRRIIPDFVHPTLTNHAILQVPLEGETLWLECTNPQLPFGYTHADLAGRPALVYRNGTATVEEVECYPDSLNLHTLKAEIVLNRDGSAKGSVRTTRQLHRYEDYAVFPKLQEREKINRIKSGFNLVNLQVSNLSMEEDKSTIPSIGIHYDVESLKYGSMSGNRLFIPLNPFFKYNFPRLGRENQRKTAIRISQGFFDREVITLDYPDDMEMETGMVFERLDTPFGIFDLKVFPLEGKLIIRREFQLYTGEYDTSMYGEFKQFIEACDKTMSGQLILVRKQQ